MISGELNPVFQGIYSTRIEVKQAMRNSERMLTTAEKLSVIAGVLGMPPRPCGDRTGVGAGAVQSGARSFVRRDGGQSL